MYVTHVKINSLTVLSMVVLKGNDFQHTEVEHIYMQIILVITNDAQIIKILHGTVTVNN